MLNAKFETATAPIGIAEMDKARCRSDTAPLLVSTEAARRMLSCGKTKLFQLIREQELETVQLGSRRLVVAASVQEFVERLRQSAT